MTPHGPPSTTGERFGAALERLPLVAILRGLPAADAAAVGLALEAAGFALIEVPLNSPAAFDSIAALRRALAPATLVGAGTVTRSDDVARLVDIGAEWVVMPHADPGVIRAAKTAGLVCMPGVATPTEAFAALAAGADALKLFPAEMLTPAVLKALRAVLPPQVPLLPVGGITADSLAVWRAAGAAGCGLGSALYRPGASAAEVARNGAAFVAAWQACKPAA